MSISCELGDNPITLFLNVLNALLALVVTFSGTWLINQSYHSLSLFFTCGLLLTISCCSNMSISCELGGMFCLGLFGLNLTKGKAC